MIHSTFFRFLPLVAVLVALAASVETLAAQAANEAMGVAVLNDSNGEVRVFAYQDDVEERTLLGWVGGGELEYFAVPDDVRGQNGSYRIAIQAILPLPQIGVSASPHPLQVTPTLSPAPQETVRIVVDGNMELSVDMVP